MDFQINFKPWEAPESGREQAYGPEATPSLPGAIGEIAQEGFTSEAARGTEFAQAYEKANPRQALRDAYANAGLDPNLTDKMPVDQPPPQMSAEEANKAFAPQGTTLFTQPIDPNLARVIGRQKQEQITRDAKLSRWAQQTSMPVRIGASLAAGVLDPMEDAAMFVPGLNEETAASIVGRAGLTAETLAGRTAARAVSGASAGAAGTAALEALQFEARRQEDPDYGLRQAMLDVALGAATGAILHAGFGAAGEGVAALRGRPGIRIPEAPEGIAPRPELAEDAARVANAPLETNDAAIRSSVSQIVTERPVDVDPLFNGDKTVSDLAGEQARLHDEGSAPSVPQAEFNSDKEALSEKVQQEVEKQNQAKPLEIPAVEQAKKEAEAQAQAQTKEKPTAGEMPAPRRGTQMKRELSLLEFLAKSGGLAPTTELKNLFPRGNKFLPRFGNLLRKNGLSLDSALTLASDAGYIFDPGSVSHGPLELDPRDMFDLIEREANGQKVWRGGYEPPVKVDPVEFRAEIERDMRSALHETGTDPDTIHPDIMKRAVEIYRTGESSDVLHAYERAVMERSEQYEGPSKTRQELTNEIPGWDIPFEHEHAPLEFEGAPVHEDAPRSDEPFRPNGAHPEHAGEPGAPLELEGPPIEHGDEGSAGGTVPSDARPTPENGGIAPSGGPGEAAVLGRAGDAGETARNAGGGDQQKIDAELARYEQRLASVAGDLTPEDQALLDKSAQALTDADLVGRGFEQAGQCLIGAGI